MDIQHRRRRRRRRPMPRTRTRTRCCRAGFRTRPKAAGWLARVRADPGRAGAIALAVVAALAVLVTIFTLMRDRPAPVMSAKLPPVERASSASPRSSADPAWPTGQSGPTRGGQRGRSGAHARTGHPGARCADRRRAAGRRRRDGWRGHHRARTWPARSATASRSWSGSHRSSGQPTVLGSSVGSGSARPGGPQARDRRRDPTKAQGRSGGQPQHRDRASSWTPCPESGRSRPAAIVAWRQANGKFTSVDQLADVDGIGPARLEKLRPLVRV